MAQEMAHFEKKLNARGFLQVANALQSTTCDLLKFNEMVEHSGFEPLTLTLPV